MPKAITKQHVEQMLSEAKLVDIRTIEEYEKLHIPGVKNIPAENLSNELKTFNKEDIIVCICNHGQERSQQAAEFLYNAGFKNTFYLQGGTSGWHE